jgi:hypothetical protein
VRLVIDSPSNGFFLLLGPAAGRPLRRENVTISQRLQQLRHDSPILVGWNEIEAYTGRSRKVLDRERRAGRLVMTKVDAKWVTTKAQCDTWLTSFLQRPVRPAPREVPPNDPQTGSN